MYLSVKTLGSTPSTRVGGRNEITHVACTQGFHSICIGQHWARQSPRPLLAQAFCALKAVVSTPACPLEAVGGVKFHLLPMPHFKKGKLGLQCLGRNPGHPDAQCAAVLRSCRAELRPLFAALVPLLLGHLGPGDRNTIQGDTGTWPKGSTPSS